MTIHDGTEKPNLVRLIRRFSISGLTGQFGRTAFGSLLLKVTNVCLGFTLAIVLARVLGAEGYGTYAYVFSLISILAIPAQFGLPKLVLRETARAQVREQWSLMRGVWRWSSLMTLAMTIALALIALGTAWLFQSRFAPVQLHTFYWGIALVPLIAFGALRGAALQGLRRVIIGKLPETTVRPVLLVAVILVLAYLGEELSASRAMAIHAVAAAVAFGFGALWLRQNRPVALRDKPVPQYQSRRWITAILPLALTAGLFKINQYSDILILGLFKDAENVGSYRVAVQGSLLVAFGLQCAELVISPYIVRLYERNDSLKLQDLTLIVAKIASIIAIVGVSIFIFFGKTLLVTVFGEAFKQAYIPLVILSIGQVFNSTFGPVAFLLNMTQNERAPLQAMAVAATVNILLNLSLIPHFGLAGAASATSLALAIWNFLLWRSVRNRLGIESLFPVYYFKRLKSKKS
ncbi:O-antigen/teichoic acid export membrane protein [Tamilnaduibacter salinus]|uniref:O-antigen/teichoic acid export membrane protein n=1 Tax=Tamilnaduibacter salinus TaxID=1484056 RepID=A0A2U1CUT9_9GAMM|nr:polysaccharide biosynthesis C-terminal domain-containing protein [Tamilnaduibacter salinus]PVY70817.1 O-antigen/teichoic acid export membrane protein [Tamilnaduibacter salinus]